MNYRDKRDIMAAIILQGIGEKLIIVGQEKEKGKKELQEHFAKNPEYDRLIAGAYTFVDRMMDKS